VFVRLVLRSNRIVEVRRAALLDVAADHMRHNFAFGKTNQALGACHERRKVAHVQAAGIEAVACEQDASLAVVISQTQDVVAGNRNHVEDAVAEVEPANIFRPMGDAEELAGSWHGQRN